MVNDDASYEHMTGEVLTVGDVRKMRERIAELEAALSEAIDCWEDSANYKGDYLKEKHGDAEGIALARAILKVPL
jgi:hypothetical protein